MQSLPSPGRDAEADYDSIASRRAPRSRTILRNLRSRVFSSYRDFIAYEGNGSLLNPLSLKEVAKSELLANYRLLERGRSHEHIRDDILSRASLGLCIYCSVSPVESIDHLLPQSIYPEFTVFADNLVPACGRCNRKKGRECAHTTGRNMMNPYFFVMPKHAMLFARVRVEQSSVTCDFYLRRHRNLCTHAFSCIDNLFQVLELDQLYSMYSVLEMSDRAGHMDAQYRAGGPSTLKRYLRSEWRSAKRRRGPNYWKAVILRTLARSSEFCSGGYRRLLC